MKISKELIEVDNNINTLKKREENKESKDEMFIKEEEEKKGQVERMIQMIIKISSEDKIKEIYKIILLFLKYYISILYLNIKIMMRLL